MNVDAAPAALEAERCFHCGGVLPPGGTHAVRVAGVPRPVCCAGCEAAAGLILGQGLGRFYEFRTPPGSAAPADERDWTGFDRDAALRRYTHLRADGERELSVQLEGLHCAACAWLIERSVGALEGVTAVQVNATAARAQLRYDPRRARLSAILERIHTLGFLPLPLSFDPGAADWNAERRAALRRLAVAGFGMMQVMTYATSLYVGALRGIAPDIEQLLRLVSLVVSTPVVLYAAQPFFVAAWRSTRAGSPGMDVPVALSIGAAYAWSVWATLRGHGTVYFDSAVMFTFFLLLGRYVEMSVRHRCGLQNEALARLLPASVLRLRDGTAERVTTDELVAGDCVRLAPGERVPADGEILCGRTEVDESLLTGESTARVRGVGDALLAGSLNLTGPVDLRVSQAGQDTTLAAHARLLERAGNARPRVAELADRIAVWFVAGILLLAIGVAAWWLHADPTRAFPTVLAVLVVTCPCALSLATPVALAAATTRLARAGLLVTRSHALERLARADVIVLDKTGTLTRGEPRLHETIALEARIAPARALAIAAALESRSGHPLARAFAHLGQADDVDAVQCAPGRGIEGRAGGTRYRIGRLEYVIEGCRHAGALEATAAAEPHTSVVLGDADGLLAVFRVRDALRSDARETLAALRGLGLAAQVASGDHGLAVSTAVRELGLVKARADMSAADKLELVRELQGQGHCVAMVGDGVNDAPVLAAADVSVAIAGGADLARVSADLVLLGDGLGPLVTAVRTSRQSLRIIRQNLAWAVLYNATAVPLAASGWLEPWMAAIGMSASSLVVALNATRLLAVRKPRAPVPPAVPVRIAGATA